MRGHRHRSGPNLGPNQLRRACRRENRRRLPLLPLPLLLRPVRLPQRVRPRSRLIIILPPRPPPPTDHNARSVGQISLVDEYERVLCNLYVRPDAPVVSYLTPLTGLTPALLAQHGMPLAQAVGMLCQALPPTAILVGQNISKDVQWLGLREGQHFQEVGWAGGEGAAGGGRAGIGRMGGCGGNGGHSWVTLRHRFTLRPPNTNTPNTKQMMDLTGLFRVWNPQYKSWSVFGQVRRGREVLGRLHPVFWCLLARAHWALHRFVG